MELTNAPEGSKLLAGLSWEHGSLTGIAYTPLVLGCVRQAAEKLHTVKLQCRPSEASYLFRRRCPVMTGLCCHATWEQRL